LIPRLVDVATGAEKCEILEERLDNAPRWRPQLKRAIAEVVAECIVRILGEENVEEIYMVDLAGGEAVMDFAGRDVDLIVKIPGRLIGHEGSIKVILEEYFNAKLKDILAWYVAETGKRDLIELHVITDYDMGYGRLVTSSYVPAIRLYPKRRQVLQGQVFPYPF